MIIEGKSGLTLTCPPLRSIANDEPLVTLRGCSSIRVVGDWIGAGVGRAIEVIDSDQVEIEATFTGWHRAVVVDRSRRVSVTRCRFLHIRSDGLNVREGRDISIQANEFRDFSPFAGDHGDAIWIATAAAPHPFGPSHRVRIVDNLIDAANCNSIFVASPSGERHSEIVIERNLTLAGSPNGIFLSHADASAVRDNHVLGERQHIRVYESAPELAGNVAREWQIDGKWQAAPPLGNKRAALDPTPLVNAWHMRRDPRWTERETLRASIPADTAARDGLTKKLSKDRARLRALDKALGV